MKRLKDIITILCIVLLISIGLNIVQALRHNNAFRKAEERYMVQVNCDIKDAYKLLKSFIAGENRSEKVIHGFAMQLDGLQSLFDSNINIHNGYVLYLKTVGAFIAAGGSTNRVSNMKGIYVDGVVSDDEIAFLQEVSKCLKILVDNACLDYSTFNETLIGFGEEWDNLPFELLAK